jgi:predicted O-methyltransferase YrrM
VTIRRNRIRSALGRHRRDAAWVWGLRGLPRSVLAFHWRALRHARRTNDAFSVISATRPADVHTLLELARGRRRAVELGTGTGWTTITLALDDPERRVVSYDTVDRGVDRYLSLVAADVRERIELIVAPGSNGPGDDAPVDLLYVDSSHERAQTIAEVHAWRPFLRSGALILLDDYSNPNFPGVREAVSELGLAGTQRGALWVHEHRAGGTT